MKENGSKSEPLTIEEVFVKALNSAGVAGGIVRKVTCDGAPDQRHVFRPSSSLRETLGSITKIDPRYKWHDENGIINLLPRTGEPVLLKTRIREFRARNAQTADLAVEKLLALPEVRKRTVELHMSEGLKMAGLNSPPGVPAPRTLRYRNVSLRTALNEIARAYGGRVWRYIEFECNGETKFSIVFY